MLLPVTFERIIPDEAPLEITPSQVGPETLGKYVVLRYVTYPSGTITDLNDETCECLLTYDPILPQGKFYRGSQAGERCICRDRGRRY